MISFTSAFFFTFYLIALYFICVIMIKRASPAFLKAGLSGIDLAKPKPAKGDPPRMFEIIYCNHYLYYFFWV